MDKKEIKVQLRNSLEFKQLWNYFIVTAVILSLFLLFAVWRNPGEGIGLAAIIYGVLIAPMVITWYIVTELGSIVENAAKMGAPVPPWLVKFLAAVEDATDHAGALLDARKDEGDDTDA